MDEGNPVGVFTRVKNFFSINSLKVLYKYTIGSCVPEKCSTRCLPSTDTSQTKKRKQPGKAETKLEDMTLSQIINEGRELVGETQMKKKVNLHFENHIQKWRRLHFPWKPIFHILLVALVTAQVGGKWVSTLYMQLSAPLSAGQCPTGKIDNKLCS